MDSLNALNVSKSYNGVQIVRETSITLEPGTLTALLGSSGAGKSTLLRLIAGLEDVDAGEVKLGDKVISRKGSTIQPEKRRIGLVFQDFALFPHLTAVQNIRFGLRHLRKEESRSLSLEWLERLELVDRANSYPHQLSGGEQQRVAIARALAPEPAAILMDEPFSGLDPTLRANVRQAALKAVAEAGIPALLVTHDSAEAMAHADKLAIMRRGSIIQQGMPDELYFQPVDLETAQALGPVNRIDEPSPLAALFGKNSVVREEAFRSDPDGPISATLISARRVGAEFHLVLSVNGHGHLAARMSTLPGSIGDVVRLSYDPLFVLKF